MGSYYDIALSISNQMQNTSIGHSLTCVLYQDDYLLVSVDVDYQTADDIYLTKVYRQASDEKWHVIAPEAEHNQDELIDVIIELLRVGYEYTVEEL